MGEVGLCARTGENEPPSDVLVCGVRACVWLRWGGLPPGGSRGVWGKQVSSKLTDADRHTHTHPAFGQSCARSGVFALGKEERQGR